MACPLLPRRILYYTLLVGFGFAAAGCSTPQICPEQISWAPGSERVDIAKNDRLFICGDPAHPSWEKIPPRQAASFLRSFLESQAYLNPVITVDYDANKIVVDAGRRTNVTSIIAEGDVPPNWDVDPLKMYLDKPLEKTTLDLLSAKSLELLKSMGYGCSTVSLRAYPDGRVVLELHAGKLQTFPVTRDVNPPEVDTEILARYEPFHRGDPFDIRKSLLAGRRMEVDAVASSSQYLPACAEDTMVTLDRAATFGPRRSWELGFGATTEEYPLAFARWKSSRLWSSASSLRIELFGSNIRQNFTIDLKWFALKSDRRFFVHPGFEIEHKNEKQFETFQTKIDLFAGRTFDTGDWMLEPEIGTSLRRIKTYDFAVPRVDTLLTPTLILKAHTHDYELYLASPRTGSDYRLTYEFIPNYQTRSNAVHRAYLLGTALWNYRDYLEPRWVLGGRFSYGSLFTVDGSVPDPAFIPPDWLFLLGGDRDLRGFGRNTLPSETQGAGSALTFGFESRWPGLFDFPFEPLVLFDFGWLGSGNGNFDKPLYLSPGIGARSATPLGTIRGTVARGLIPTTGFTHTQFFLSFGTEF